MTPVWLVCVACGTKAEVCRSCSTPAKKVFFCARCGCVSCRRAWHRELGRFDVMLKRPPWAGWFTVFPAAFEGFDGAMHLERAMTDLDLLRELIAEKQFTRVEKLKHLMIAELRAELDEIETALDAWQARTKAKILAALQA